MAKNPSLPDFDSLWDYNHPDITEEKFRSLLPATSGETSYHVELLTQIARAEGLQRKFDDAHKTLDRAASLLTDDMAVPKIRYLLERGRVFNSSGDAAKAREFFLSSWELALSSNEDHYAVDAAHMIAITESPDEALKWNEKGVKFAENSKDEKARNWLGSLYNNIGWNYHDKKNFTKALEYFEKDFKWYSEKNKPVQARIARWSIARTLRSMKRTKEALEIQKAILHDLDSNNEPKDGFVHEEIGECLMELGKEKESKSYFTHAYELLSKPASGGWLGAIEPDRLERLKRLGGE